MVDIMRPAKDANGGWFWRRAEGVPRYPDDVPAHIFDADRESMCVLFDSEQDAFDALRVAYAKSQDKPDA